MAKIEYSNVKDELKIRRGSLIRINNNMRDDQVVVYLVLNVYASGFCSGVDLENACTNPKIDYKNFRLLESKVTLSNG